MTKYREIIRLASLNLSQTNIALSCGVSKKTVNKVLKAAREKGISWPLDPNQTDVAIEQLLFPKGNRQQPQSTKRMPDYAYILAICGGQRPLMRISAAARRSLTATLVRRFR